MSLNRTESPETAAFKQACSEGDLPSAQAVLASRRVSKETLDIALQFATKGAHLDVVAALLNAGAPISARAIGALVQEEDVQREGPQDPHIIRAYFDHGLKPRKCISCRGLPLLCFADAACARKFLRGGVDPNRRGSQHIPFYSRIPLMRDPLACALRTAYRDGGAQFHVLVEHGAKMDGSLFFGAIVWSLSNTAFKTRFLLAKGLGPNTTCADWGTPLHAAIRVAFEDVIQILLDAGADPTARTGSKQFGDESPIELAESKCRTTPDSRDTYQRIIRSLKDAQGRRNAHTTGIPEKSTDDTNPKLNMDVVYEHSSGLSQVHTRNTITETPQDHTLKKQKTGTRKSAVNNTLSSVSTDSISSRTRSRAKIIPWPWTPL